MVLGSKQAYTSNVHADNTNRSEWNTMKEQPVKRSEIAIEDTWDLTVMYANRDEWEKDLAEASTLPESLALRRGRTASSADSLLETVKAILAATRRAEKIFTYAHMIHDQDLSDPAGSEMNQKAMDLLTSLSTAVSWFNPEILSVPEKTINKWLKETPLSEYVVWLQDILRNRPHILSAGEEKILALANDATRGFSGTFSKLNNVEIPARFPSVKNNEGKEIKISHGNFVPMLQNPDRKLRKEVFDGFYGEIAGNIETLGALLDGQVRTNIFRARARSYPSALEASLFKDRVNRNVYESLITAVHKNLPIMHKYYHMKKASMKLDKLHIYDVYTPTVPGVDVQYTAEEGKELTLRAVSLLGEDYVSDLSSGFQNRWTDLYENKGKRSGAYSGGCYDSPPYMLLNFSGTLDSVFTMAHEAGHSMHSWYSRKMQPYNTSDYKILVAEVASITNEMLLADTMLKSTDDNSVAAYLIDSQVNDFRTTLFRQTMFAEFELLIHQRVEGGESLSADWLSKTYFDLVKLYHGDAFEYDDDDQAIGCEWARIPHFYYNFYVYKYATGMASAASISERIIHGKDNAVSCYLKFLSSGGSKPPLELLREIGVDLETPAPVEDSMKMLQILVDKLEKMLER